MGMFAASRAAGRRAATRRELNLVRPLEVEPGDTLEVVPGDSPQARRPASALSRQGSVCARSRQPRWDASSTVFDPLAAARAGASGGAPSAAAAPIGESGARSFDAEYEAAADAAAMLLMQRAT